MDELVPGVYDCPQAVPRGGGEFAIHPSAIETDRGVLLVDVGFPDQLETIESHLAERSHDLGDVWAVLCTHQDGDHVGGLADVVERTGALVLAHRECAPYVDGREQPIKSDGDRYPPVAVDIELAGGETLRTAAGPVEVVFTPGHAPGHVSLFVREAGLLLAGDALTVDADGALAGPSERHTLEMDAALDSVAALANLAVASVHCHHGGHVAADADDLRAVVEARR